MRASFKLISTLLIILLTILLIAVFISYYNKPIEINNEPMKNIANANHDNDKLISDNESGENKIDVIDSGEISIDDEKISVSGENKSVEQLTSDINKVKETTNNIDNTIIITSEDIMTNKEKRQILTELDKALLELLDVVDKVQTVDETRLVTSGSEVQK